MILITGFAPYREALNASGALVQSLRTELPPELEGLRDRLVFEVLGCDDTSRETEHQGLEAELDALLNRHRPTLCIFTGQAPKHNKVTIEMIATNSFMCETIDRARPVAYWSNLPGSDTLKAALEDDAIPADYSFYGGQHLCNHILFSSLYFAERDRLPHRSGFIHIPVLPEQTTNRHRESAFMPLEMTRRALSIVISHVVAADTRAAGA